MPDDFTFGGEFAWRPSAEYSERSHAQRFMRQHGIETFPALLERSTADVAWFTDAVLKYLGVQFETPYAQVLDLSGGPEWPRWCVGGRLNIVLSCVDRYAGDRALARRPAVVWEGEEGQTRTLTYLDLYLEVNHCANALRELGVGKGQVVALLLPMTPEAVIALLAVAKIGGIALPLFSGYGAGAIAARLNDAGAVALVTADGFFRRGQVVALKPTADEAAAQAPSVREVLVVRRAGNPVAMTTARDHWWHEVMPRQSAFAAPESMEAEDPLMLLYTSGTSGKPKGAVHTHCGFPVKAAQDMALGLDVQPGDTLYWVTDMGWMMGPWLVFGTLLLGATMFIYDGAPDQGPAGQGQMPDRLWALAARHKLTHLGVSPTLVRALSPYGEAMARRHDLSALRYFASTGEPWNPDPWWWLFQAVGEGRRPIINYSGGTEVSGGILMGSPLLPLKPCAFSAPCPGMAADVVDEAGQPVRNAVGELVIRQPWIGMTRGFWRDPERYLAAYWQRFPGVWVHGDFAAIDADGAWYLLGRSDDTIKIAGKRLGPAEVESVLVHDPSVVEAAAIGVPDELKGSVVVCFVVLAPGVEPSEALNAALREQLIGALGKALQPREIRFVRELPKTRNAKVMRRLIRAAYLGQPLGDTSALENPAAVEAIGRAS
ncbi:MAG: AMP-binding protein [Anaerolineales bacterium]|nr:AMP-binding protein [Anaerolineales bacterium]